MPSDPAPRPLLQASQVPAPSGERPAPSCSLWPGLPTSVLCWLHSLFTLCRDLIYLVSYLVDICSPAPPTGM